MRLRLRLEDFIPLPSPVISHHSLTGYITDKQRVGKCGHALSTVRKIPRIFILSLKILILRFFLFYESYFTISSKFKNFV